MVSPDMSPDRLLQARARAGLEMGVQCFLDRRRLLVAAHNWDPRGAVVDHVCTCEPARNLSNHIVFSG